MDDGRRPGLPFDRLIPVKDEQGLDHRVEKTNDGQPVGRFEKLALEAAHEERHRDAPEDSANEF